MRCHACGAGDEAGPLDACPTCPATLHLDCQRFAGCPDCPEPEAEPSLVPASSWRRQASLMADGLLLLIPGLAAVGLALGAGWTQLPTFLAGALTAAAFAFVNVALFLGEGGATLGKKMLGVRVVDRHGRRLGWRRAVTREYLYKGLGMVPLAGALVRRASGGQALHDLLAGTQVLEERRGAPPALPAPC